MTPARGDASAGRLLGLGWRAAMATPAALAAVAGTLAAESLVQGLLPAVLLRSRPETGAAPVLVRAALALLVLAGGVLSVALAGAARAAARLLETAPDDVGTQGRPGAGPSGRVPGFAEAVEDSAGTGLGWAALVALVDLGFSLWFWTGLAATGAAFLLGSPGVSALAAPGLALVLLVGLVGGVLLRSWLELALAHAVTGSDGLLAAAGDAGRSWLARPGLALGAFAATALPAGVLLGLVQTSAALAPSNAGWPASAARFTAVLLVAAVSASAAVVRLDAYVALALDRANRLPAPPSGPAPGPSGGHVPVAALVLPEPVLDARLVDGPAPEGGAA